MPQSCRRENKPRDFRLKTQLAILAVVSLFGLNVGLSISHAAVLVPQIQAENGTLHIDQEGASWIASLYSIASPLGCLLGGVLAEVLGRRAVACAGFSTMAVGWLMICFSQNTGTIMAGRSVEGVSKSIVATALTVLLDETIHPTFRGFVFFQSGTTLCLGIFAMMGLANLVTWRMSSLVACGVSAVSCLSVLLVVESPTWLVRKGQLMKAEKNLYTIWGPSRRQKAREVLQNLKRQYITERTQTTLLQKICSFKKILTPRFLKPFLIIHIINVLIQLLCGSHLVINYGVDLVSRMSQHHDPFIVNTILSIVRILVCVVFGSTMTFFGRRGFMMISGVGSTVFTLALAGVLYYGTHQETLSIVLLGAYVASFTAGFLLVPTMMIGETLPAAVRSLLCGYIYTINDITAGGVVKSYPWLLCTLGLHGMFLMFGVSCAICALLAYLFLPETNGKTLEEIEEYFRQDNIMWITRNRSSTRRVTETDRLCDQNIPPQRKE